MSIKNKFYEVLGRIAWGVIKGKFRGMIYKILPFLKPKTDRKEPEPGYGKDYRREKGVNFDG